MQAQLLQNRRARSERDKDQARQCRKCRTRCRWLLTVGNHQLYDSHNWRKSAGGLAALNPLPPPNRQPSSVRLRAMLFIETARITRAENLIAFPQPIQSLRLMLSVQPRPP